MKPRPPTADIAANDALYRPKKIAVTMRYDADVLAWFKARYPKGYQTAMNAVLREYVLRQQALAASKTLK